MPFSIQCNNKGCGQIQNPFLDKGTDKVFCSSCNGEITNVTIFAKNQMKSLGQFGTKKQKSFSIKCTSCSSQERPIKKENQYCCGKCKKELSIPAAFKLMLDAQLPLAEKDESK